MFVTLFNFLIKLIGCGSAALRNILVKIDMKGCWIDHHSILVSTKTFAKIFLLKFFFFFFTENSWYSSLKLSLNCWWSQCSYISVSRDYTLLKCVEILKRNNIKSALGLLLNFSRCFCDSLDRERAPFYMYHHSFQAYTRICSYHKSQAARESHHSHTFQHSKTRNG